MGGSSAQRLHLQVPLVDAAVVPVLETRGDLLRAGLVFELDVLHARVDAHLLQQGVKLLAEGLQALEPVVPAVLVAVADEQAVKELEDVDERLLVLVADIEERICGNLGLRGDGVGGEAILRACRAEGVDCCHCAGLFGRLGDGNGESECGRALASRLYGAVRKAS